MSAGRKSADVLAKRQRPGGREGIWLAIRAEPEAVSQAGLADVTGIHTATIRSYMRCLVAGGYLEPVSSGSLTDATMVYRLVKDHGAEAPRVRPDGTLVVQGVGREQLWRTIRAMRTFTAKDLALQASTEAHPVSETEAKYYLKMLAHADYVRGAVGERGRHYVYTFNAGKNTGPRPPQIQRQHKVFDPNLRKVVWSGEAEEL